MTPQPPVDFHIGDLLRLRKQHPCGGFEWRVYRLGADIGIRCTTCDRHVMIERRTLEKRVKKTLERGEATPVPGEGLNPPGSSLA
jgi:hypothetical protein